MGCCTCGGSSLKLILLPRLLYDLWLGIQQKTISLFDVECSLQSSLIISGCSSSIFFNDNRTESESENMMNFLGFSFETMSRAKSIAQASAVKTELSIGRAFVFIILFKTAAHKLDWTCNDHLINFIKSETVIRIILLSMKQLPWIVR